ncbi:hypothetical protein EDB86DRAFT_2954262 [Lactarius hatsudake]|nr:hypothetical protein EDB86DRAFT_2954262 [Lactarius hatsudake]
MCRDHKAQVFRPSFRSSLCSVLGSVMEVPALAGSRAGFTWCSCELFHEDTFSVRIFQETNLFTHLYGKFCAIYTSRTSKWVSEPITLATSACARAPCRSLISRNIRTRTKRMLPLGSMPGLLSVQELFAFKRGKSRSFIPQYSTIYEVCCRSIVQASDSDTIGAEKSAAENSP